jgi:predicted aldo/keto reductase-like oxidoreductase
MRQAMVDALGADVMDHYLDGLPPWYNTPGYFNIPAILWLRSLVLAYDMHDYGMYRYNMIGRNGHWFPGMNAAHVDDWDLSGVLQNSRFAEQIPGWLRETHEVLFTAKKT